MPRLAALRTNVGVTPYNGSALHNSEPLAYICVAKKRHRLFCPMHPLLCLKRFFLCDITLFLKAMGQGSANHGQTLHIKIGGGVFLQEKRRLGRKILIGIVEQQKDR